MISKHKKRNILIFTVICVVAFLVGCDSKSVPDASFTEPDTGLYVIDMQPAGVLPVAVKYPSVYVQFSLPVVSVSKLGEPADVSEYMTIDPPLEGVFRWYGTSLLCFDSDTAVVPQRKYTVTLSDDITAVDGTPISGPLVFSFTTEPLKLLSVTPGYDTVQQGGWIDVSDVPPEAARSVGLYFSYPVQLKEIRKYISVTALSDAPVSGAGLPDPGVTGKDAGDAASVSGTSTESPPVSLAFTASQPDKNHPELVVLTLKKAPPENAVVTVTMYAGARSEPEALPVTEDSVHTFHTLKPLSLVSVTGNSSLRYQYQNPAVFRFSHRLADNMDFSRIAASVHTVPEMVVTAENVAVSGSNLIIHGLPVAYEQTYTIRLDGGCVSDCYGRVYESDIESEIQVPEAERYARFKDYGLTMLESRFEPRLVFEYQNIEPGSRYQLQALAGAGSGSSPDTVTLSAADIPENSRVIRSVELSPYLSETGSGRKAGTVLFSAEISYRGTDYKGQEKIYTQNNEQVIQVTDLGMTVRYGFNRAVVLVTSLSTGRPVSGATVSLYASDEYLESTEVVALDNPAAQAVTDDQGVAVILLQGTDLTGDVRQIYVGVEKDGDKAIFAPETNRLWGTASGLGQIQTAQDTRKVTYMFTDRGLYKPGELLYLRGIDRNLTLGEYEPYQGTYTLELRKQQWNAEILQSWKGSTSENGGFSATVQLPESLTPGTYVLEYTRKAGDEQQASSVTFTVAYFERLRFEMSVSIPSLPYISGDRIPADITASYLGGGSLAGASWNGNWYREPAVFHPDDVKYDGFSFGPLSSYEGRSGLSSESGILDSTGTAAASGVSGGEGIEGSAYTYRFEATVTDAGGQAVAASASTVVHPARFYIGTSFAEKQNGFPKKNNPLTFDVVLVTPDGSVPDSEILSEAETQEITVELLREDWKEVQQQGLNGNLITRWNRELVLEETKTIPLQPAGTVTITPPQGGAYVLRLTTADDRSRPVVTEQSFYVTGSDWNYYYSGNAEQITLIPDKTQYDAGDTAQLILQSPLPAGMYLVTVEREGIFSQEVMELEEPSTVLEIPVTDRYLPVVYVTVSSYSVRTKEPDHSYDTRDMDKPKGYFGAVALHVNPRIRSFDITVTTDKPSYRPGELVEITLKAEKAGQPLAGAELTLLAVDRGVLDLIDYHVPSPVDFFYQEYLFPSCVSGGDSRSLLMDPVTYEVQNAYGGDKGSLTAARGGAAEESQNSGIRSNFDATAVFIPAVKTGSDGTAVCRFVVPDTLTEYRVTAVGVLDSYFALTEDSLVVSNPVSVREVLPRTLRVGDTSDTGAVISNLTGEDVPVTVSLEIKPGIEPGYAGETENSESGTAGSAEIQGRTAGSVTVPAGRTSPLMFNISALEAGGVTLIFTVSGGGLQEKIVRTLDIDTVQVYETVTTTGEISSGNVSESGTATALEKVVLPEPASGETGVSEGTLTVSLDATRLGTLGTAVAYIFRNPYNSLDQRCAAMIPLVYFSDYMDVFGMPQTETSPKQLVEAELSAWSSTQKPDGGFPYWKDSRDSSFAATLRFAELIAGARKMGVQIPAEINTDALVDYLLKERSRSWYRDNAYVQAYALYVVSKLGRQVPEQEIDDVCRLANAGFTEQALCGLVYLAQGNRAAAESIADSVRAHCRPTVRGVDITDPAWNSPVWFYFNDLSERNAVLLQFFTALDPSDDMNGRLLFNLLEIQRAGSGYWSNVVVTARVLEAVASYIQAQNLESVDVTGTALLGGITVAQETFTGAAARPVQESIPLEQLIASGLPTEQELPLELTKDGTGNVYYTVSLTYPVPVEEQYARDEGFSVFVELTDVATGKPVTGTQLTAGTVYRARVTVSTTRDRTFVALRVPIPAGAEILNAAFVTTEQYLGTARSTDDKPTGEKAGIAASGLPVSYGLSAREIYNNEIRYFWDGFQKGWQQVEFLFRAVRQGDFTVPGATAECMYEPEVFGRAAGGVYGISE